MASRRPPGTIAQMLLLGLLAGGLAGAVRFTAEKPLPLDYAWSTHVQTAAMETGMRTVSVEEAKMIADSFSHIVLDARKATDFAAGRIPGSMSLPASDLDAHLAEISALLTPAQPVLVYCSGAECEESLELGQFLIKAGYTNVTLFAGGITAWKKAGYPVEQ